MNKITAVIVTYNRLNLLKESVNAVRAQSLSVQHIIVVNNGSTDGTEKWLSIQKDLIVKTQENLGGSGGFYTGIKEAAKYNADWVWIMDDDTICSEHTLAKLVEKLQFVQNEKVGFICSKGLWTDGNPHLMNLVDIKPVFNKTIPFNQYDQHNLLLAQACSFVSVMINMEAVRRLGLPYKDFYIWGDDQEYTHRITNAGFLGLYCPESIVLHKTPKNYFAYIVTDTPANLWKHAYGFRNEFFQVRKNKGVFFYLLYLFAMTSFISFKILKGRKDNRFKFIKTVYSSAWKSLFFNPKIDMV
jgi:rhamnopyranosyl-N-acetylglucosaminyl-diphospho-decaprenol beta-1,3/1,4-galactofuranosyltransferase